MYICTQNAQSWDIITKNEMTMIAAKKYNPNFNYGEFATVRNHECYSGSILLK